MNELPKTPMVLWAERKNRWLMTFLTLGHALHPELLFEVTVSVNGLLVTQPYPENRHKRFLPWEEIVEIRSADDGAGFAFAVIELRDGSAFRLLVGHLGLARTTSRDRHAIADVRRTLLQDALACGRQIER